jgi:hypothetical protein
VVARTERNRCLCSRRQSARLLIWNLACFGNELLTNQNISLQQKTEEANKLAQKYNDLSTQFEDAKRQLEARGEDPKSIQAAQELLHQGKLEEALDAIKVADMRRKVSFQILATVPGKFTLLINNATDQILNIPHSKLIILGEPSQTFDMTVGGSPGGPPTVAFPALTRAPVTSVLFDCANGRSGWNTLYAMRYGPNPSLDQRQCKVCLEARIRNGEEVEKCEDLRCSGIAWVRGLWAHERGQSRRPSDQRLHPPCSAVLLLPPPSGANFAPNLLGDAATS